MGLRKYDYERVRLIDMDGDIFEGLAEYVFADDNEPEEESLIIEDERHPSPVEIFAHEIKSVEIIK